jgi:hypothetical protein
MDEKYIQPLRLFPGCNEEFGLHELLTLLQHVDRMQFDPMA